MAQNVLETSITTIESNFEQLRAIIKITNQASNTKKADESAKAKDISEEIESLLNTKCPKALQRITDETLKKKFTGQLKQLEETYSTLKNNLTVASQTNQTINQPISNVEKVSKTTTVNDQEIEKKERERQKRKEEDAKRRELEQQQNLLQRNTNPKQVNEILQIQQETVSTLQKGAKINQETISIGDQVCKKLADQTEQMISIQKKFG